MPVDQYGDDDDERDTKPEGRLFKEFECPECTAWNPLDDGFRAGDVVLCSACGMNFEAQVTGSGRLKLVEP